MDLINQLPKRERAVVLYHVINNLFNQFENQNDNQIENQNENAYISVSLSVLGKSIYNLLSKNIVCREFSTNYGGKRLGAGAKKKSDNIVNTVSNVSTSVAPSVPKFTPPTLEQVLAYAAQQNSVAGMGGFKCTPQIAEEFWSNYESTGWVVANDARTPVRDWQAKLRQWALRQARMPATTPHESAREQKNRMAKEKLDKWLEQVRQNAAKEQGSNQ